MKILFLSRWFPYPPDNGSKVRILNLLRVLAAQHQITLLTFDDEPEKPARTEGLAEICNEITVIPWKEFHPTSVKSLLGFFSLKPRSVIDTFSPAMAAAIQKTLATQDFDVIIASEIEMASYQRFFGSYPAIFEEIEIGVPLERFKNATALRPRLRSSSTWLKHKYYLKRLLKYFPHCTVTSDEERNLLIETGIRDQQITVIPNFIDWRDYQHFAGAPKNKTIIYTGSFRYPPNHEAMVWFLEAIFPAILASVPETQLIITGDHLNLPLPSIKNVTLTGFVDEIRPLIAQAAVSIVPLLTGGGTRLKILEAMALQTAVVSTAKGAQGIEAEHEKNMLLVDSPAAFSQEVIRILTQPALGEELAANGLRTVKEIYSPEAIAITYNRLLEQATK